MYKNSLKRRIFLLTLLFATGLAVAIGVNVSLAGAQELVEERGTGTQQCTITVTTGLEVVGLQTAGDCPAITVVQQTVTSTTQTESTPEPTRPLRALLEFDAPLPELAGVDNAFAPLWADIQEQQAAFYEMYGRHWQGLTIGPGITVTYPSDQAVTWADFLTYTPATTYTLRIDTYNGPAGPGYIAVIGWGEWESAINHGIEDRGYEWRIVPEEQTP